ncbi:MAG: hypothetical protein ABIG30_01265, partial [Candidatus Aenigmatarchaeota archaeon]
MEKTSIVEFFMQKNHLLTPDALEKLNKTGIDSLSIMENKFILGSNDIGPGKKLHILKNFSETNKTVDVHEIAQRYMRKYDIIKNIIVKRTNHNFVSMSNLP